MWNKEYLKHVLGNRHTRAGGATEFESPGRKNSNLNSVFSIIYYTANMQFVHDIREHVSQMKLDQIHANSYL